MLDQASKLREIIKDISDNEKGTRIYSIISGKGGVGKTKFAINLEEEFKEAGKKTIALDVEKLHESSIKEILGSVETLSGYEVIIINNPDGLSENSLNFTKLSHEAILVTMPGVTSITETYKFLKVINQEDIKKNIKILVNNRDNIANEDTFKNLSNTTGKFLDMVLEDITDTKSSQLVEQLYKCDAYDLNQLRDKIINIFG